MKKVCIVTASRSEYGPLRWIIDEFKNDDQLLLQLVVTGTHLSPDFGLTYTEIEKDGYKIDEKVETIISSTSEVGVAKTMGLCSLGFADVFNRLRPDIVVVLGDRYELLPICSTALIMNIPIAHISGGDITEGAIDDQVRNAVTMMSTLHFPSVEDSFRRIERMRGCCSCIYTVGEPGLDNFKRLKLWDRLELAKNISLKISKKWVLLTYHPETKLSLDENVKRFNRILNALDSFSDIEVVITGSNSDYGGLQLNEISKKIAAENLKFKYFDSLGQLRYLSFMNEVDFVIGNSSSGIIEAPFLAKNVINIGNRQKGRYISELVIEDEGNTVESILYAISKVLNKIPIRDLYYGDGETSKKIKDKIKTFILNL